MLKNLNNEIGPILEIRKREDFVQLYNDYVTTVSTKDAASSFEQCSLLAYIMEVHRPRKVLDTGSGLSTSFIRAGLRERAAVSVTFESSPVWLEKTRQFLTLKNLSEGNLFLWSDIQGADMSQFDFVYHDMSTLQDRMAALDNIASRVENAGAIMLDDLNWNIPPDRLFRDTVAAYFANSDWVEVDIKALTIDAFGRYAGLFLKK